MDWGQSMKRLLHFNFLRTPVLTVALGAIGLSGCTTMRGAPANVLDESNAAFLAAPGKSLTTREEIITYYVGIDNEDRKREFRNRVVDHYMGQIDKQYEKYSTRLFSEGIELALGFDAAIIGLASTASLFEEVADDLATVISGFAGIKSAIDKNLYFDRTLPALIVTMDAGRTRVETEIIAKKQQSVADYTIESAIRDLRRYQHVGTLMRAVTRVTETASQELAAAETDRMNIVEYKCEPNAALRPKLISIQTLIGQTVTAAESGSTASEQRAGREGLAKLAKPFGIIVPPGFAFAGTQEDINKISLAMATAMIGAGAERNFCTAAEIEALEKELAELGFSNTIQQ